MLAQMPSPTSYQAVGWIVIAVAALAVAINSILKLTDRFRGTPPNEALGEGHKTLSARTARNENSIRTLYNQIAELREFTHSQLQELKAEMSAASERRHETIVEKITDLSNQLARLDERTKSV